MSTPCATPSDEAAPTADRPATTKSARRGKTTSITALTISGFVYLAWVHFGPESGSIADAAIEGGAFPWGWYSAFLARTFAFHAGLALIPVVAVALWCRRWRTAIAGLVVVLLLVGPDAQSYFPRTGDSAGTADFRVMSMNSLWVNTDPKPAIEQIRRADPDVLVLQEYTSAFHEALLRALGDRYPFQLCDPGDGHAFGAAILSKFPFTGDRRYDAPYGLGQLSAPRAVVRIGSRDVVIHCVHLIPPTRHNVPFMLRQFRTLQSMIAQETDPVVIAGDFNFTTRSSLHQAMLRLGLTDAQEIGGSGRGATWPRLGLLRFLPGIALDHVYLGNGIRATSCRVGDDFGSDHRPLIVDVRFDDP